MDEIKLTQEQLDQMLADAKKGLFTEDELNRRVTAEVDRRVDTGIKKGVETEKAKWEREFAERAKLTAEELAAKEIEEKLSTLTAKEREVLRKSNELEAKSKLADAGIPKAQYEKFIGTLVNDNEEVTNANVDNFIAMFNQTKLEIESKVRSEVTKITPPNGGKENPEMGKQDFDKMGYAEKLKFKKDHPELYAKFIK